MIESANGSPTSKSAVVVALERVYKTFEDTAVLQDVSLSVHQGEILALLGPSGCGKTTLLRILAGLEKADRGEVRFSNERESATQAASPRVGFVFQHYALFSHMTVFENVAFGLRVRPRAFRPSDAALRKRVNELLELVRLSHVAQRYPREISGGQRQRVALARALAVEPRVLLLDEPFAALDATVRKELRRWLRKLHDEQPITTVLVTHDQADAMELSDRVALLKDGRLEQVGTTQDVYAHPSSPFVCSFLGEANHFEGEVEAGRVRLEEWCMSLDARGTAPLPAPGTARIYIRPHDFEVTREAGRGVHCPAIVRRIVPTGASVRLELRLPSGRTLDVDVSPHQYGALGVDEGSPVHVAPTRVSVFPIQPGPEVGPNG